MKLSSDFCRRLVGTHEGEDLAAADGAGPAYLDRAALGDRILRILHLNLLFVFETSCLDHRSKFG